MISAVGVDDGGRGGIAVVFLHSLAGRASHWAAQLAHLRPTRRALALELPGHGAAPVAADGDYTIEAMGRAVAHAVGSLGLERLVIAGHSFGGGVALEYAGTHSDQVAGLLLVDPNGDGRQVPAAAVEPFFAALGSPAYSETIEDYWLKIAGGSPALRQRLLDDLRNTPRDVVVRAFRAALAYDPTPALERFRGPTLSIVTPYNDGPGSLHRLGAGLPHRIVKDTGHWIQLEKPEEVNRLMDEFLNRVNSEQ